MSTSRPSRASTGEASRWVAAHVLVFAALTLAVSYFGLAVIEFAGLQEFDRTAVSLLNLVLYVVPLATMLMAVQSFREEGGATEQLFAEPVTRTEVLLGKLLGLTGAHLLATLLGFGCTGLFVGVKIGTAGLGSYLVLVGFSALAGTVYLALAASLTLLAGRRARSYAVVLVAWFLLVLLFDLLIVGLSFVLPEAWANREQLAGPRIESTLQRGTGVAFHDDPEAVQAAKRSEGGGCAVRPRPDARVQPWSLGPSCLSRKQLGE